MTAAATFCATLVDEWVRSGITDAVVAPGSRSTPLAVALVISDLQVHVHHDERSAGFLALGLARASGRPVIVLTTSGTAAAELLPAVVEADLSAVPLVVCTADRPPELRDRGAPQTIDQQHLFGRSVRWFHDPGVPADEASSSWRSLAARAVGACQHPRPGPVHLNLPVREPLLDDSDALPTGRDGGAPWTTAVAGPERIVEIAPPPATRGVIVAGRTDFSAERVLALAEALGWPVLADHASGARHPDPHVVSHADAFLRDADIAARLRPAWVIRIGEPPASRVQNEWIAASGAVELAVGDRWRDPSNTVTEMIDGVPVASSSVTSAPPVWLAQWRSIDDAAAGAIASVADASCSEPGVARAVIADAPDGADIVVSSSMPVRDVEWYAPPRAGVRVIANRGANGIDGVVSTAVGVALAGAPTVLLIGDVAFLHDSNGLLGAGGRGIDLTVVVVDNDGGGIFSFLPQADALELDTYEQLFGTPHGLDVVALARAYGIEADTVDDLAALRDLIRAPKGVRVAVVRTTRAENRALHAEINQAVANAVAAALPI